MKKYAREYEKNIGNIKKYYNYLINLTKNHNYIGITNEWIVDNYYMLVEQQKATQGFLKSTKNYNYAFKEFDLYKINRKMLKHYNYKLSFKVLKNTLNTYQDNYDCSFSYRTISTIDRVLYLIVINELSNLCDRELTRLKEQALADELLLKIENKEIKNINDYINKEVLDRPIFLERLYNGLKEQGELSHDFLNALIDLLDENEISLNRLFEQEYEKSAKDSVIVTNLFYSISLIAKSKVEKLYAGISTTEKVLDMDLYYAGMTKETKELYREELRKKAKKEKLSEYECAKKLLEQSIKENKHIGALLLKTPNLKLRRVVYLSYISVVTILFSYLISKYFFSPRWLSTLLLIIPASEIVIQLTNKILINIFKPVPLPKLDYTEGIPKKDATMVVIATIINSKQKVEKMFETLETYYLANKSENLYFTLLGDCSSNNSETAPFDNDVIKAMDNCSDALNKKYGDIFNYVYRRRIYNDSEGCYLGWERKRGALQNLNQLLLRKLSNEDCKRLFQKTSLQNFDKKIKYVITLDTDTKLVLKAALNLVGVMAHPLNKPVLNEAKDKVIAGYGIMQPKLALDIESSNKTMYTQVYAGIGGFDIYNSVIPNFYQDVFKEGSFIGKGIYDLEIFDQVLTDRFPTNLILSHDLLEGNYVRCGFVSDVEMIDDFPPAFLIDATRRHRWARGDMQIIAWLFKDHLNSIERFKIFDNIRRSLLELSLLVVLAIAFTIGNVNPMYWVLFICFTILLPIIYYVFDNLKFQKERSTKTKQYENIAVGFSSLLVRALSTFVSIPYNTKLYLEAFSKSLYRMFISKKNLLNWLTAEEAERTVSRSFTNYIKQFTPNYLTSFILIILVIFTRPNNVYAILIISLLFCLGPVIFYFMGLETKKEVKLTKKEKEKLLLLANKTWNYFDELLTEDNNYLIPDNYQLNRETKEDYKTSPTDISFSIIALISANELGLISAEKSIETISKIITSIESLEKWNGHLYNWYNIKTKDTLAPYQVSTVDSGNLVAALITAIGYLNKLKQYDLSSRIRKLIDETNFNKLYKEDQNVFTCSYDTISEQLNYYNYNKFASESRLTSFVAIAKGDILPKHWFLLDKTLTKFHDYKGLLSWSGTSFEYFMPLIYMKDYPNTLIDESYYFAYYCQKEYMEKINPNLPWGISESAYNVLDDAKNYQYQAFGTPYLRFHDELNERIVIAPYASLLVLPKQPKEVFSNYLKYQKIGMEGEYGLYESYDVEDSKQVFSYFSHHQGMIIASLTNYLKENAIQKYFYEDIGVKAFDVLNKEKMQIKPMIDSKVNKYKRYIYEKEIVPNDIRSYDYLKERPEVSVLSNSNYTVLVNDYGNGFSRYKTIQLNRYRKISENDYGIYLYIKDIDTNKVWSNTYAPTRVKPDRYLVTFALDEIEFVRHDEDIITHTEIITSKEYNAEIRKVTLRNMGDEEKTIELTSYFEPTVSENADDISHRVFNNFALKSSYDEDNNALVLERRLRTSKDKYYVVHKLLVIKPKDEYSYETEKSNFMNRNEKYSNPIGLHQELTNYVGDNIDPVTSMRNKVVIEPEDEATCYLITGLGKSKEQVLSIVKSYNNPTSIEDAFKLSAIMTNKNIKRQGLDMSEVNLYNKALNYLYQTSKINLSEERRNCLLKNSLSQRNIWRFGISGDRSIILVEISDITGLGIAKEVLKMFEYYKTIGMYDDIVIINSEDVNYAKVISNTINEEIRSIYSLNNFGDTPGSVTLIEKSDITEEELNLFRSIARLKFDTFNNTSLSECIEKYQIDNAKNNYELVEELKSDKIAIKDKLDFDNSYGGFINDGKEYLIKNPNTPAPWSNVLCNSNFGTVITNNDNGFTYAYNSREFKISSWTNDVTLNDKSEGFKLNNQIIDFYTCKHGFGYSTFEFKNKDYKIEVTYFVPTNTKAKISLMTITNLSNKKQDINMNYWINPVLGTTEDKTARHIVDEYDSKNNIFTLENKYLDIYKGSKIYLTSSEEIVEIISDPVIRGIKINLELKAKESKELTFILGCEDNQEKIIDTIKHLNPKDEFNNTIKYWKDMLSVFKVKTPDKSFDYMMNGWLLYQTLASRIVGKTGFYQVGGAFGFRDQLQDCTNIAMIHPVLAKEQIINCARHQFKEGDVLHWWHPQNKFGLRSKFKDDYLWLIYATSEYIRITGDLSILSEKAPFVEGELLTIDEEERGMEYTYTETTKTILEHLELVIDKCFKELGSNGLPLMGGGDWNDGMNHIGIKGSGTSVWLGFFIYDVVNRFKDILRLTNEEANLDRYDRFNTELKKNILKKAWDGKYYLRAINDDGVKIGSSTSKECEIDLISQSFAILTDIATEAQRKTIIEAVDEKLVDKNNGLIKLLTPPFTGSWIDPGYIKTYPKGIRENGGQYTHACAWYIMALERIRECDKAYEYYAMINPINHTKTLSNADNYKVEPYVIAADIYSNKNFNGRGGWTWYTGSSGWFYKVGLESILGIKKYGDALEIDPHIPSDWDKVEVLYRYIDTTYKITILKGSTNEIKLDQKKVDIIKLTNDLKEHVVTVKRCNND